VLEGDIKGCFDHISHEFIMENIPLDKEILWKWLKSGYIETRKLFPTEEGTPQGGAISPTLCNMVLDGLEKAIKDKYHRRRVGGKIYFPKVYFIRYADDFIVTSESKELLENGVLPIIRAFMAERGLELSEEKTVITHIPEGFDFLGLNVRKYKGKLLIKPSKKNIKAFLDEARETIKNNPSCRQEELIRWLNAKITGWVNFHKFNVSAKAFEHVDYQIWKALWQWAKRRHKKKGHKWIAARYWHRIGNRDWTFSVPTKSKMDNGETYYLKLAYATDTDIRRWTKIKSVANPFDEDWQQYFEERETDKTRVNLKGRAILAKLFAQQKGVCPACGEKLTVDTGYKIHYVVENGKPAKLMVHPGCHNEIHYLSNVPIQPTPSREL
jgi:RNA-directed DNA polymerase